MENKPTNINDENEILFTCTRRSFEESHCQKVLEIRNRSNIDWNRIYATAELHQVTPLIYVNLLRCIDTGLDIPLDIINQFKLTFDNKNAMKKEMLQKLRDVLSFFNNRSIDVMVVKLTEKDLLHDVWYAPSNDIDLVTRKRRDEISEFENAEIKEFLQSLGRNQHGHLLFELEFFEHHDVTMLGILPIDFQLIWDAAVETNYQGQKVYFMSPEDVLLSVCINSRRRRYFRLKSLYEITEHLNNKDAINWREFVRRVREARCNSIVYTSFLTTQLTLGCELPPGLREDLTINSYKASAISCIIRYLSRHVSLYSLHPYSDPGISILGLKVNLEMLITHTIHLPNLIRHLYKQRLNFREISDIVKKD